MIKIGSVFIIIIVLTQNSAYRNVLIIPKITSHIFDVLDIVGPRRLISSKEMS